MASISNHRNRLLASLSEGDQALLDAYLEPRQLRFRQRIEQPGRKIRNIYFIEQGMASIIAIGGRQRRQTELAMIGFEGMTGISAVLAAQRSPNETIMQVAGRGLCITAERLLSLMSQSETLSRSLYRYAHALGIQSAQTLLANTRASIEERLARWLLMSQDRLQQDELRLTQEFLALMLGVRRPGVTLALQRLEKMALVSTRRGVVQIVDRAGLIECAAGHYGVPEDEYRRLFGG